MSSKPIFNLIRLNNAPANYSSSMYGGSGFMHDQMNTNNIDYDNDNDEAFNDTFDDNDNDQYGGDWFVGQAPTQNPQQNQLQNQQRAQQMQQQPANNIMNDVAPANGTGDIKLSAEQIKEFQDKIKSMQDTINEFQKQLDMANARTI